MIGEVSSTKKIFLLALILFLLGWGLKLSTYLEQISSSPGIYFELFPAFFRSPGVALSFYALPFLGLPLLILKRERLALSLYSGLLVLASGIATLHLYFFNDATFTTAFWSALFFFWFALNSDRRGEQAAWEARTLSRGMVGMVFFGGAVGKMTGGYWDGTVLFDIYFQQKENFPYSWFRENLEPERIETLALLLSRGALIGEFLVVFGAILLPFRLFVSFVVLVALGMVAISTPYLLSVMAPLLGALVLVLLWTDRIDPPTSKEVGTAEDL